MYYIVLSRTSTNTGLMENKLHYGGISKTDAISAFTSIIPDSFSLKAPASKLYFLGFDSDVSFLKELEELDTGAMTNQKGKEIADMKAYYVLRKIDFAACANTLVVSGYDPKIVVVSDCEKCGKHGTVLRKNAYGFYLCPDCWAEYAASDEGLVEYYIGIAAGEYKFEAFSAEDMGNIDLSWREHKDSLNRTPEEIERIENGYNHAAECANYTQASTVIGLIDALPDKITLNDGSRIQVARIAYNELPEDLKDMVTNYAELEQAEQTFANLQAAEVVIKLIDKLPGIITLANEGAVTAAREAYQVLNAEQQYIVKNNNLSKLDSAETRINNIKAANNVIAQINNLPASEFLSLADEPAVEAVRAAYEGLTDDQELLVTNLAKLREAEAKIVKLNDQRDKEIAAGVSTTIMGLPAVEKLTLADQTVVEAARAAYNALTDSQKGYVTAAAMSKLVACETSIENQLIAKEVDDQIAALPDPGVITLEDEDEVRNAEYAYKNNLTVEQRKYIKNSDKLVEAQKAIAKCYGKAVQDQINALPNPVSLSDKAAVEAASKAYNNLTQAQKIHVNNYFILSNAEKRIVLLESSTAEDVAAADAVQNRIACLPTNNDLLLAKEADVIAAREAYNALTPTQMEFVTNHQALVYAERTIAYLKAEAKLQEAIAPVVELIDALPNLKQELPENYYTEELLVSPEDYIPEDFTIDDEVSVVEARQAYDKLQRSYQAAIKSSGKLRKLEDAEKVIDYFYAIIVYELINLIPPLPHGAVHQGMYAPTKAASAAYNSLTASQKAFVKNYETLRFYEDLVNSTYGDADADTRDVIDIINELALVGYAADDDSINRLRDAIEDTRTAYGALTEEQRDEVTNYQTLLDAEERLKILQKANSLITTIDLLDKTVTSTNIISYKSNILTAQSEYLSLDLTWRSLVTNYNKLKTLVTELNNALKQA